MKNCMLIKEAKDDYDLNIRAHARSDWVDFVFATHEDRDKIILIADSHEIADYNDKHPGAPLKILDQRILKFNDFIGVDKEHEYLIPLYIKAAKRLQENGLLERVIAKWIDLENIRPPEEESDPVVLTFSHVNFIFIICGAFLAFSAFVFVLEFSIVNLNAILVEVVVDFVVKITH